MLTPFFYLFLLGNLLLIVVVAVRFRRSLRSVWARIENLQNQIQACRIEMNSATNAAFSELASQFHKKPVDFQSQHGEDIFLWKFFNRKTTGRCVEVGAFDGKQCSNTYAFETLGWDCVLIEPDPEMAERCLQNRPCSRVIQAAIGPASAVGTIVFNRVRTAADWSGMMSFTDGNQDHLEKCRRMGAKIEEVNVPYRSLNDVLAGLESPVDFVSIDVEGHELNVLDGFDLERFRPEVIMTECTYDRDHDLVGEYLLSRGYVRHRTIGCNHVFVRSANASQVQDRKSLDNDG
jgi:FkbM family methyltransferase